MNVFDEYTKQVLSKLNKRKVDYIVIGGYAVNFHGYNRTTGDIDLWIRPDNGKNKERLLACLVDLEVPLSAVGKLAKEDFNRPTMFRDGERPFRIDFITHISCVNFEEAWTQKKEGKLEGIKMNFLHLDHLIISKIATGRPQDKADIDELQKIQEIRRKKK